MQKLSRYISIILILLTEITSAYGQIQNEQKNQIQKDSTKAEIKKDTIIQKNDTITVIGVGDIMLGTNYPTSPNYLPPHNDCSSLLAPVVDILKDADITFGNNEGTYSDKPQYAKSCGNSNNCYRFSMPEKYVNCLVNAGFDLVSIANNHSGDLGAYGRKNTVRVLSEAGLHFAGLVTHPTDTFTINGVKYGFCAFAPNAGTCQITNYDLVKKTIQNLKKDCQIVIVSFHGGAEGSKHEHLTRKTEYFLGQNRGNVYKFAHTAVDAGADIVFGQGPHVTRAIEVYKNRFIAYSLGNFCTYKRFNLRGVNGIAPIVKIYVNDKGEFLKGKITAVYQDKMTGTKLDPDKRIIKRMQELQKEDIPEALIKITDEGEIIYKD